MVREALLACAILIPALALANDGAASSSAGGIQLIRQPLISMEKERLTISPDLVTVEYEFLNTSARDITTEVAFPLAPDTFVNLFTFADSRPVANFSLWIDGQLRAYETETKAFAKGVDRTDVLKKWKIDIASFGHYDSDSDKGEIDRLSSQAEAELTRAGLIDKDRVPLWDVRLTYHWRLTFPAHRIVRVRHEYKPAMGFGYIGKSQWNSGFVEDGVPVSDFCIDPPLRRTLDAGFQKWLGAARWIDYILTTANTWKTPIKDFELVIQKSSDPSKERSGWYVSFCWDGKVVPGSSGTFIARVKNFRPTKELRIGFFDITDIPTPVYQ